MTDRMTVFVNAARVEVPPSATALDAVRTWNADAAAEVEQGTRALTDSRGLALAANAPLYAGAIMRVVAARDRASDDADLLH
ncbi:MAG TPA: hypothetical protein VN607_02850 [Gemmatimonadaceae bacterium]|nr:hypothetical protein [Gemmatimonadaceae bacterium]